jgi:hypothetical protein
LKLSIFLCDAFLYLNCLLKIFFSGELQMNSEDFIICDGNHAIVQKVGGGQLRLCRLTCGQRVLIEKLSFDPSDAIGKPFGIFEVLKIFLHRYV